MRSELGRQAADLRQLQVKGYVAGETVKTLAAEHGLHHQTVRAVLIEAGVLVRTRQRLTQTQLEEIVQPYESGLTTTEIGERYGVCTSTVGLHHLKQLGVGRRAPGSRSSELRS